VSTTLSVVMMGATGAVGTQVLTALLAPSRPMSITSLVRRRDASFNDARLAQQRVDVLDPPSYRQWLAGHKVAICTLGVGQPSKMSAQEFTRIDKDAVLAFATACKQAGVRHFQLLGSVGASADSRSFYLRSKGELQGALIALGFERLSIFQPSMILTPTNRYGCLQGLTLVVWPWLNPVLRGSWQAYRGVKVSTLGAAIARNAQVRGEGVELIQWRDFQDLAAQQR
jgi:uncharacterized protein YbjT (DUF2867 family)